MIQSHLYMHGCSPRLGCILLSLRLMYIDLSLLAAQSYANYALQSVSALAYFRCPPAVPAVQVLELRPKTDWHKGKAVKCAISQPMTAKAHSGTALWGPNHS